MADKNFKVKNGIEIGTHALETANISYSAAGTTVNFDALTSSILYYTNSATGNWTLNIRGNASTTLASILGTGQMMTVVFMATQGATAYYQTAFQIDGTAIPVDWQTGIAPASGNASQIDVYSYTIMKTAATAASATATGTSATTTITTSALASGTIAVGQMVSGTGIGANAVVTAVSGSAPTQTVTLSVANTAAVSGTITFRQYLVLGAQTGFA